MKRRPIASKGRSIEMLNVPAVTAQGLCILCGMFSVSCSQVYEEPKALLFGGDLVSVDPEMGTPMPSLGIHSADYEFISGRNK